MAMGTRKKHSQQPLFLAASELPQTPGHPFYAKLNEVLAGWKFGDAGGQAVAGTKSLGTLKEIVQAAERGSAAYLLPYPRDVLQGTKGEKDFDPTFADALAYGAKALAKSPKGEPPASDSLSASSATPALLAAAPASRPTSPRSGQRRLRSAPGNGPPAADTPAAVPAGPSVIKNFQLNGEKWTCEADGKPLEGILIKPKGDGPFPAILISHGMGSTAAQFGKMKATEFVKWGMVCIATDYTHAHPGPDRSQLGSSPENLRRAKACLAILKTLPYVDSKRVAAYGNSMGAFLTIGLSAEAGDQLAAAAITAGGVVTIAGQAAPSTDTAAKIRVPFLILHGSIDRTVPPERSALLKQILDKNNVPNERKIWDGVDHNLHAEKSAEVYEQIRAWFVKNGVLNK